MSVRGARLLVAACGLIACHDGTAPFLGASRIVYACNTGPNTQFDICVVAPDGTDRRPIVSSDTTDDRWPAWSRNGRRLAWGAVTGAGPTIEVANSDGSAAHDLPTTAFGRYPAWSPDGGRVAFTYLGTWVIATDGSGLLQVVPDTFDVDRPTWSPDGQQIVVGSLHGLVAVKPDGGNLHLLTTNTNDHTPSYSPEGARIAIAALGDGIDVMNADGSNRHRVVADTDVSWPSWSPDGDSLVFVRNDGGVLHLYIISTGGANEHLVNTGADSLTARDPSWALVPP